MIDFVRMRRLTTTGMALALAVLLDVCLAAALFCSTASAGAPIALLPPQLQALEGKMARLGLNSERFSVVSRGFFLGSPSHVGSGETEHLIRTSFDTTELGEASLSPAEGEVFLGARHRPARIAIGATLYEYTGAKQSHRRRKWVRVRDPGPAPVAQMLPFHGGDPLEVDAGGAGPFAALINLMTTATGPVGAYGPVLVRGQPTTEFTATVEPRWLIEHLTVEDVARFKSEEPIQKLQIFVTEAGLPIRVVARTRTPYLSDTSTTEILAVNIPVAVVPPPARELR
jgi:hypothetical protein